MPGRCFISIAILLTMMSPADHVRAQDALAPGVALALAEERAARIRDVRYELRFSIPEAMTAAVTGSVVSITCMGPVPLDRSRPPFKTSSSSIPTYSG